MYKNIEDRRACYKRWYQRNKSKVRTLNDARRDSIRAWLNDYKKTLKCQHCKENHPACLEFHHLNSKEKDFNIGMISSNGSGIEAVKKEIDKCIVLCANCHKKHHYTGS